eukprot:6184560-Pleurochrysis_carterae.AAC.1
MQARTRRTHTHAPSRRRAAPFTVACQRLQVVPVSSASLTEESTAKLGEEESQTRLSRVSTASQPPCARIKFLQACFQIRISAPSRCATRLVISLRPP